MRLSIIIVNYNTKELLKQCLESVISGLSFHQSPIAEIIVVDNGSTDGSVEIAQNAKRVTQNDNLKFKIVLNNENLGFAKAVNQALRQVYTESFDCAQDKLSRSAQGKVFLLLNSDTIVKPGALEKLLEFEEKVRPAIIGARLLNPDGTTQPSVFHLPTIKRAIGEYWLGKKGCFSKYAPLGAEPVLVEAVSGGAMLISGEIIEKIGLFDERYFMFFEDLDYCRRAGKAGYKIFYLPTAEIIHEHGASGKNLAVSENQWKRLIPSSKIYHGRMNYYWLSFILRLGQKWQRLLRRRE